MAMAVLDLSRRDLKEKNRQLRESGRIPGILYGGKENVTISVELDHFRKLLELAGRSNLVEIHLEGKKMLSLVKDFQIDPLTDEFIHFDLLEVNETKEIRVMIPLEFEGTPKGVMEGGVLEILQDRVEVACMAKDIPSSIPVDISHLELGFSIHLKDVPVPKNARFTQELSSVLLVVAGGTDESQESDASDSSAAAGASNS